MSVHTRKALTVVSGPGKHPLVSAPPILNASDHTVDYTCGTCGTVLMHAEENQIHGVAIFCRSCGGYNLTDL